MIKGQVPWASLVPSFHSNMELGTTELSRWEETKEKLSSHPKLTEQSQGHCGDSYSFSHLRNKSLVNRFTRWDYRANKGGPRIRTQIHLLPKSFPLGHATPSSPMRTAKSIHKNNNTTHCGRGFPNVFKVLSSLQPPVKQIRTAQHPLHTSHGMLWRKLTCRQEPRQVTLLPDPVVKQVPRGDTTPWLLSSTKLILST